ncbi:MULTISPECIES: hypothetical protein [unclassified Acidovorax]|uniref:hypothetical protein n=1 Tax=unclassified Acidovorax TaxID=2684926 RepID=UPI002882D733|nr:MULTISPECIES: hypothetical protein [unclassified Acidovorax]
MRRTLAQIAAGTPAHHYRDGGPVRGPGTGTSDDVLDRVRPGTFIMPADSTQAVGHNALAKAGERVPVRLSNGEHKLAPEQVFAIGLQTLEQLKDATHKPVAERPSKGRLDARERLMRLADGGMVSDVTRVGNSYSGGNVGGDITINGRAPSGTFSSAPSTIAPPAPNPATVMAPAAPQPASLSAAATSGSPGGTGQTSVGTDWAARNAQQDADTAASSITNRGSAAAPVGQAASTKGGAANPPSMSFDQLVQAGMLGKPRKTTIDLGIGSSSSGLGLQNLGSMRSGYADGGAVLDNEQRQRLISQIPAGGQQSPAADGSQERWSNTETGRNLSNIAAALPGSWGGAIPAVAKTGGAISGGINAATRLMNAGAGAAAISALPGSAAAQTPSAPSAGAGRGFTNPASVNPAAPPPVATSSFEPAMPSTSPAPTTNTVTRVGNSYSGSNVAGDITVNGRTPGGGFMNTGDTSAAPSPVGMTPEAAARAGLLTSATPVGYNPAYDTRLTGQGAQERLMAAGTGLPPRGQVSQQNMTAADNLAARQGEAARARLMALATGPGSGPVQPGSFTGGSSGVIGSSSTYGNMLGRSPEQRLRDAAVSASSLTNRSSWGGRGAENNADMLAFRAALQQDSDIRQNQAGQDLEGLRQSGSLAREGLQQTGATERTNISARRDDAANQIAKGRLTLEQIAAGYTNRSADRIDRAQVELENARTPETQRSARELLMALAGRAPQNEWGVQVTPTTKNADGSSTQGSVWRYNKQTGETARVDAGQPADIGKDPRAVAIRDNAKLSPQQKRAELQRLGYL